MKALLAIFVIIFIFFWFSYAIIKDNLESKKREKENLEAKEKAKKLEKGICPKCGSKDIEKSVHGTQINRNNYRHHWTYKCSACSSNEKFSYEFYSPGVKASGCDRDGGPLTDNDQ